jgi:hypothetical protein
MVRIQLRIKADLDNLAYMSLDDHDEEGIFAVKVWKEAPWGHTLLATRF